MNDEFTPNATGLEMPNMTSVTPNDVPSAPIQMEDTHEVKMAQAQVYRAAKNSIELHKMLKFVSELEGWVQAKITIAAENLEAVKNYIEYEMVSQTLAESNATNEGIGDVWQKLKQGAKEVVSGTDRERQQEEEDRKAYDAMRAWRDYYTNYYKSKALSKGEIQNLADKQARSGKLPPKG